MKPWIFAAGIETLITLVIFVAISALSTWLKNRNAESTDDSLPPPPRIPPRGDRNRSPQPERETKPVSWEDELRRLLEGETPAEPPPRTVAERRTFAPPPLPPVAKTPAPPPTARRRVIAEEAEPADEGGLAVEMPTLAQANSTQSYASQVDDRAAERLRQGSAFAEANASFARASQLHELTAARLRQVTEQTPALTAPASKPRPQNEGARVAAMLRNPGTIRTAIVASVVLGKPKATEF